jgi:hypothetical protein
MRAGEAFADASYYSGRPFDAMEQLKRLLKRDDLDYYARVRIQARITELTPLVMELHKRRISTDDNPTGSSSPLAAESAVRRTPVFRRSAPPRRDPVRRHLAM